MMNKFGVFVFLFFIFIASFTVFGEFFSAISELEKILQVETELAGDLRKYIKQEEERLANLKKIAEDFHNHSKDALYDSENYLGNPVNAFLLVKRFTSDWDKILEQKIKPTHLTELLESVNKKTLRFPTEEDLEGAGKALMRLQDTYAITSHDFSTGSLFTSSSKHPVQLNTEACFKLGSIAYTSKDFYHTILWMNEALSQLEKNPQASEANKILILDYLAFSYYMQGNVRKALNLTVDILSMDPDHIRVRTNLQLYKQLIAEEEYKMNAQSMAKDSPPLSQPSPDLNPRPMDAYKLSGDFTNYESLCRGEETHLSPHKHKLRCFHLRHHPFLFLRPVKAEEVNWDPRMYLFHDVITEKQINAIKSVSKSKLGRSVVYHKSDSSSTTVQEYRVSKSAWLKDEDHKAVKQFSFLSSILSNLTLDTVEDLQVLNYGIGGHYEPHYDFSLVDLEAFDATIGNRVATFICYLSDVAAGGATVFPGIGVSYWPKKGKCAFWYNLKRSGAGDLRTRHAACPVLSGIKWVCNKWFHERGQEFIRPCLNNPKV